MAYEQHFEGQSGRRLYKYAYQSANRMIENDQLHEDAVQHAMLKLWQDRDKFRAEGGATWFTWAYAVLRQGVKQFWYLFIVGRKDAPIRNAGLRHTGPYPAGDGWHPSYEDDHSLIDLRMRTRRLTPRQGEVIAKVYSGMTFADIGREEDRDPANIGQTAKRAAWNMRLDGSHVVRD